MSYFHFKKNLMISMLCFVGCYSSSSVWADTLSDTALRVTNNPNIELELEAGDAHSGVIAKRFGLKASDNTINWKAYTPYPDGKELTNILQDNGIEGMNTYAAQVKDKAGNQSSVSERQVYLDMTGPIITDLQALPPCINNEFLQVKATALDNNEGKYGISSTQISLSNVNSTHLKYWTHFNTTNRSIDTYWNVPVIDGLNTVYARGIDSLGNIGQIESTTYRIDTVLPTGTVQIDSGLDFIPTTSTILQITVQDIETVPYNRCGVKTVRIFDVYGTGEYTFDVDKTDLIVEGVEFEVPWELATKLTEDDYEIGQVGIEITDRAGNVYTTYSQVVKISKIIATCLTITDVINPKVWGPNDPPFQPMQYCNQEGGGLNTLIPVPLIAGGSFSFDVAYIHPPFATPNWNMNYRATLKFVDESSPTNGPTLTSWYETITRTNQPVNGLWSDFYRISLPDEDNRIKDGISIYIGTRLDVYDNLNRLRGYDFIPRPEHTYLKVGTIEDDIRRYLIFNEIN